MSSSTVLESKVVMLVQSGIAAWEDTEPVVDWRRKTVTVIASRLTLIAHLLWTLVEAQPSALVRMIRLVVVPTPPAASGLPIRRFTAELEVDPPGFRGTSARILGDRGCSVSELVEPGIVDPDFLTDYRHCALLGIGSASSSTAELCDSICSDIAEINGASISKLLESTIGKVLIRLLEMPSYSVLQLLGSPDFCEEATALLEKRGIRRVHDVRQISEEIARLRV